MTNLMIVDDERMIRQGLKVMIEREYPSVYNISMAGNGAEALEQYKQERQDVIITDIRMPIMDGITLLARLSAEAGAGGAPAVIILSGHDDFEYAKSAIRYRVKDYLLKPIRREELFEILERIASEGAERESSSHKQLQEAEGYRRELRAARLRSLLMQQEGEVSAAQEEELAGLALPFTVGVLNYHHSDGTRMKPGEVQGLLEQLGGPLEHKFTEILTDGDGKLVLVGEGRASWSWQRRPNPRSLRGCCSESAERVTVRSSSAPVIWRLAGRCNIPFYRRRPASWTIRIFRLDG